MRLDTPGVNLEARITHELSFFASDEMRERFLSARRPPDREVLPCQYGGKPRECTLIAANQTHRILYCDSEAASFPWGVLPQSQQTLGSDDQWFAYLYEAFVSSPFWPNGPANGFTLHGPGERT
jgi:hypothetical protein